MHSRSSLFACSLSLALLSTVAESQPRLIDSALNVLTPQSSNLTVTSFGMSVAGVGAPRSARGPIVFIGAQTSTQLSAGAAPVRLHLGPPPNGTSLSFGALPPGTRADVVATGADMNGDGVMDLVVGSPSATNSSGVSYAGRVHVVSGATGSILFSVEGATGAQRFGASVALADVRGDGQPELIVGVSQGGPLFRGEVRVFTPSSPTPVLTISDPSAGAREFGDSVTTADFDNDGKHEIVIGAPGHFYVNGAIVGSGAVQIYRGDGIPFRAPYIGATIPDTVYPGPNGDTNERAGANLSIVGDLSGDGIRDIVSGGDEQSLGFLTVLSGATGAPLQRCRLANTSSVEVTDAADYDRDGRSDIGVYAKGSGPLFAIVRGGQGAGQPAALYELSDNSLWQISSFSSVPFGLSRIFLFGEQNFQGSDSLARGRVFTVMANTLPTPPSAPSRITCQ